MAKYLVKHKGNFNFTLFYVLNWGFSLQVNTPNVSFREEIFFIVVFSSWNEPLAESVLFCKLFQALRYRRDYISSQRSIIPKSFEI